MPPEVILVFKICASLFLFNDLWSSLLVRRSRDGHEMGLMYGLNLDGHIYYAAICHQNGGRARLPVTLSDESEGLSLALYCCSRFQL